MFWDTHIFRHQTARYNDFPSSECPNHQPLGSGCSHGIEEDCTCAPMASFVIVSQGVWHNFAEQHGNGAELQHLGGKFATCNPGLA